MHTFQIAEQTDPAATGQWDADSFVLATELDTEELIGFFVENYRPTPIVSPWNNSSGFGKEGTDGLSVIEQSSDPRLLIYRKTIAEARCILEESERDGWSKSKKRVITECRSRLPGEAIGWIDSAVLLLPEGDAAYPPITGTGGNVGRLDFARNFHEHIVSVLGLSNKNKTKKHAANALPVNRELIKDALFQTGQGIGVEKSASQFDPGAVGGTNSAPEGRARKIVNPWDFVLWVEGLILFAGALARRLGFSAPRSVAAAPFMTVASPVGYASGNEEERPRGELWAPLWENAATLQELQRLFTEGRADWKGRPARTGIDLAKAAGSLGVDRGISGFSRYVFDDRDGQNAVAVPVGRIAVRERPLRAVEPIAELDPWLESVRRAWLESVRRAWLESVRRGTKPPAGVTMHLRAVERSVFGAICFDMGTSAAGVL